MISPGPDVGILQGGPLSSEYQILQFHFHWGSDNSKGSEHTLNGQKFPIELHIVHIRTDLLNNIAKALVTPNGLAVAGFFFEIGEENEELKPLVDKLNEVVSSGSHIPFTETDFKLSSLINYPDSQTDTIKYSSYMGSLTTPGCFEAVHWINFLTPLKVSSSQMATFR